MKIDATNKKQMLILRLTESAIMIALASILSIIPIIVMPFGGSVTALSMLPIAVIAYRHGSLWGIFTGFTYGLVQMLMGMSNLSYATSAAALIAIILLDYLVAFAAIGLTGIFRKIIHNNGVSAALGCLVACAVRYICHVISGCTVWAGVSIPDADGLIYSLLYNAAYMIPETLITVVAIYFAASAFTLTAPTIKRIPLSVNAVSTLYKAFPIAIAVVIDAVIVFGMMQNEGGFDITGVATAGINGWLPVIIVTACGVLAMAIITLLLKMKSQKRVVNN